MSKVLFLPHNFALRRGTPRGQTLSDRLLATLRFRRAAGECTVRQGAQTSGSTGFALTVMDYSCRIQPTVRNLDARARMHARRVVQTTIPPAQQCKQLVVSGISDDAATARSCPFSHVALQESTTSAFGHGPRLYVCQAPNAFICVSSVAPPKHQMRLYVCHQMRLYVCHQMRLYVCHQMRLLNPQRSSLRSLTFARFARTFFNSLN